MLKFITGNKKKFAEFQRLLKPLEIEPLSINLDEIQEVDPKKVIKHKLKEAFKHHRGPFIIEDSSLTFDCLGAALPGPLIKWFNDFLGTQGMVRLVKGMKNQNATVSTHIAFAKSATEVKFFVASVRGKIVDPRGSYKWGYDEIFLPQNSNKTLSQQKAKGDFSESSRGLAIKKLKQYLLKYHK